MTVIAYRDGILAADSAVWQNDSVVSSVGQKKVHRLTDGRLFAGCGRSCDVAACLAWIESGMSREHTPPEDKDRAFGALLIDCADKPPWSIDYDFRPYRAPPAQFWVRGAHIELLIGAMAAGATAEEAVALAIRYGDSAAGEVQVERL